MNILQFMFGIIVLFTLFIFGIGILGMKYDSEKLNKEIDKLIIENNKLKRENARLKKSKEDK